MLPLCRETQSLGQQMLERLAKIGCENATVGKNGLKCVGAIKRDVIDFPSSVKDFYFYTRESFHLRLFKCDQLHFNVSTVEVNKSNYTSTCLQLK